MKIRVHTNFNNISASLHIFDYFYAYMQSKNRNNNYKVDIDIKIGQNLYHDPEAINIGFFSMPHQTIQPDQFDLVIVDANHHHLEVCTQPMYDVFVAHDNCYMISGSYVDVDYPRADRIIFYPYIVMTRDIYTRPYYPQYYELERQIDQPRKNMIYINGQNRSNRQFMMDLIEKTAKGHITVRKNTYQICSKLIDSFFETQQDQVFRDYVNSYCYVENNIDQLTQGYYDSSIPTGVDGKFGAIAPGYFILDEYWQYQCVIFPESTWLNDEAFITEKFIKPLITRAIPWPVGGANIDLLYNKMGFMTAWNLLPESLQAYNYEKDHLRRYNMCAEAMAWLADHPEILFGDQAQHIIKHNYDFFFTNTLEDQVPKQLENILDKYKK